mmetsp:Transcript_103049/g.142584  ORF Transcript_103049/g.142584 Transcript_103049/m.142584 type:complete len:226 (+) Transcript_103049:457-1134(+)
MLRVSLLCFGVLLLLRLSRVSRLHLPRTLTLSSPALRTSPCFLLLLLELLSANLLLLARCLLLMPSPRPLRNLLSTLSSHLTCLRASMTRTLVTTWVVLTTLLLSNLLKVPKFKPPELPRNPSRRMSMMFLPTQRLLSMLLPVLLLLPRRTLRAFLVLKPQSMTSWIHLLLPRRPSRLRRRLPRVVTTLLLLPLKLKQSWLESLRLLERRLLKRITRLPRSLSTL